MSTYAYKGACFALVRRTERCLVSPNPPREQIEVHEPSAALKLACYLSHT